MTYAQGFAPGSGICTSYAFEVEGGEVDFLIDEVLYNSYQRGAAGK